jgi:hypothetical protein
MKGEKYLIYTPLIKNKGNNITISNIRNTDAEMGVKKNLIP